MTPVGSGAEVADNSACGPRKILVEAKCLNKIQVYAVRRPRNRDEIDDLLESK